MGHILLIMSVLTVLLVHIARLVLDKSVLLVSGRLFGGRLHALTNVAQVTIARRVHDRLVLQEHGQA